MPLINSRFALAVVALSLVAPRLGWADESCTDCHEVEVTSPMHAELACGDCHFDIDEETHYESEVVIDVGEMCTICHDAGPGLEEGPHAAITCVDCHGAAHALLPVDDLASPMAPVRQLEVCGGCHAEPPELMSRYLGSVHAHALLVSGLIGAPSCSDCHGSHDVFPAADERSTISPAAVPETCGSCHRYILDTWQQSAHGAAWQAGDTEIPVCTTCHASHEIAEPVGRGERLAFPESCGGCHEGPYETFRDSFHGKATDLGYMTAAICSDCHTPHSNLPAADLRSSVHPDNLQVTCGACHGEVTLAFTSFDPHADPADPERDPFLHLVYVLMTGLLLGVFGFFGIHDLLWLQRSAVAVARGEVAPKSWEGGGQFIRRFRPRQQITHLVVVVTFLLLAATGLPLRFHDQAWARAVSSFFGGVDGAGLIHRLAAVGTFGYFVFHLYEVVRRTLVEKEPGMLWGWKSMVPRTKDVADMWANLKYFLYMGRQPRHDRWTYWEKFDYFAVFWGVAIIGTSGLALWLPKVVTTVLPGWWLNIASIIHGDEALLAVGFIFVFHFFHTHLRPESFPLDPVIFVGSMPLERFKEERPLEYERLVMSGRLEQLLVDPPSPKLLRAARIFGFTAVAIGLLLVVGIVSAVLF